MSFSIWQKTIAILPKPFALLSIAGSSYVIYYVLTDPRRRGAVRYQILLGLSLVDVIGSICMFLGTIPVPAYVNDDKPTVYLASGNDKTCTAQAFFLQANIMNPVYNASLSVYYLLSVKYGWKEDKLQNVRWWFHLFPVSIGLGTAIAGTVIGIYGNAIWWCWITPQWNLYRWAYFFGILWFVGVFVIVPSMLILFWHVRRQEKIAARWRQPTSSQQERHSLARDVAMQGFFFCLAFVIAWIFPTVTRLVQTINGNVSKPLVILTNIFSPLQGFYNMLVLFRPNIKKYIQDRCRSSLQTEVVSTKVEPSVLSV